MKRTPLGARRAADKTQQTAAEPPRDPEPADKTTKVTLALRHDQLLALEEIQLEQRRQTGRRTDKSTLIREALDLLIQKYKA